jgi:hypothetical protein
LSLRLLFELVKFALTSQIERRTSDNTALFFDDGGRQTFDLVFRPLLFRIGPEGREIKNWPKLFKDREEEEKIGRITSIRKIACLVQKTNLKYHSRFAKRNYTAATIVGWWPSVMSRMPFRGK